MTAQSDMMIWDEEYKIHSYEVDLRGVATFQILCRYLQESAWNHAEKLQRGYSHLLKEGLLWVLTRQLVRIIAYPKWGEHIHVRTWPTGNDRLFCYRDFKVSGEDAQVIALATTTWAAIDLKKRKIQRTDTYIDLNPTEEVVMGWSCAGREPPGGKVCCKSKGMIKGRSLSSYRRQGSLHGRVEV